MEARHRFSRWQHHCSGGTYDSDPAMGSKPDQRNRKSNLTSDLGLNPNNDGKLIRLVLPELTEERRKELVKDVKKKVRQPKLLSAISAVMQTMHSRNLAKQEVSEDESQRS